MSGSKAPDFDAYELFRATHSHVSAPLRSVLDMCHWHIAPHPIFAYRGIINVLQSWQGDIQYLFMPAVVSLSDIVDRVFLFSVQTVSLPHNI